MGHGAFLDGSAVEVLPPGSPLRTAEDVAMTGIEWRSPSISDPAEGIADTKAMPDTGEKYVEDSMSPTGPSAHRPTALSACTTGPECADAGHRGPGSGRGRSRMGEAPIRLLSSRRIQ